MNHTIVHVRGLYAVSYPILGTQGHAIAALTVPVCRADDQLKRKSIQLNLFTI
jgi:DNA-binding IclR family transcriptional regulator